MEISLKLTFYLFNCEFLEKLLRTPAKMTGFSDSSPHLPAASLNSVINVKMVFRNKGFIPSRQSAFLPKRWSLSEPFIRPELFSGIYGSKLCKICFGFSELQTLRSGKARNLPAVIVFR